MLRLSYNAYRRPLIQHTQTPKTDSNLSTEAQLHGHLFNPGSEDGSICSLDTNFFVNHTEPLAALDEISKKDGQEWPLGALVEGREFLLLVEVGF